MMISPISYNTNLYPAVGSNAIGQAVNPVSKINRVQPLGAKDATNVGKVSPSECQTCKSRKYVDLSGEGNVSFKAPAHISPKASFAAVSAHEQEHVTNAVNKGNQPGHRLISASVSLKMDLCPECGTPYIAGGTTRTQIKYEESNPYEASRKSLEGSLLKGMNVDYVA